MVQVNTGKSQLSGWGHGAEPEFLFINKVPRPFMVGETISAAATRKPGGTELHFTDGTILFYLVQNGLLPALENVTVWTVPSEGTTVSNTLEYVEIYASYTTKTGKVLKAGPVKVPVAIPSELRVIVPTEPLIDEGEYLQTYPEWEDRPQYRGIKSACGIKDVRFIVYWNDSNGNLIATSEAEDTNDNRLCYSVPFSQGTNIGDYPGPYLYAPENTGSATFTRYRSVKDEGEEITLDNAMRFIFRQKINGTTLQAETYFQNNPVVEWGFYNMPTSYDGPTTYKVNMNKNSKVKFKDGKVQIGQYGDNRFWLPIWMRYKTIGGWYEYELEKTITLEDGRTGTVGQYCFNTQKDSSMISKVSNKRAYSCSDGEVTWSNQPIE